MNWATNIAPVNNGTADLHFAGLTRLAPMAEAAYGLNSLTFDQGAGAFTLSGGILTLGAGGLAQNSSNLQTINNALVLSAAQTWNVASGAGGFTLGSTATVDTTYYSLTVNAASGTNAKLNGRIGGGGGVAVTGAGAVSFGVNNDYLGETTVQNGLLQISAAAGLGSTLEGTTVSGTGALGLAGGITVADEELTLSGAGPDGLGALRAIAGASASTDYFNGKITLAGDTTFGAAANTQLGFSTSYGATDDAKILGGAGDLHVVGPSVVFLYKQLGIDGNVYADSGTLKLFTAAPSYHGAYNVASGATLAMYSGILSGASGGAYVADGGTLFLDGYNGLAGGAISVAGLGANGTGGIVVNGYYSQAGSTGPLTLRGDTRFNIAGILTATGSDANQLSNIAGPGGIEFTGVGRVNLLDGNTYQGDTTVNMTGGYVRVQSLGAFGAATSPVVVKAGTLSLADTDYATSSQAENITVAGPRTIQLAGGSIDGVKYRLTADVAVTANSAISGTNAELGGAINGSGVRLTLGGSNLNVTGAVHLGSGGLTVAGSSVLFSSNQLDYTGATIVSGTLREAVSGSIPAASNLQLAGTSSVATGILELSGDFTRPVGVGAGQVQFTASGGFAAYSADRTVNLGGGGGALVWASTPGFLGTGQTLRLGLNTSLNKVTLTNALDLNAGTRTVMYGGAAPQTALAEISGSISNGALQVSSYNNFNQTGYLKLSGNNSFSALSIAAPVRADGTALPTAANLMFNGAANSESVLLLSSDFARTLGTGSGQVQWTGSGGFAAIGQNVSVTLSPVTLAWGSGSFVPLGSQLILGAASATHTLTLTNAIALGSVDRTIYIRDGSAAVDTTLSGVISGTGALMKDGAGALRLTGTSTFDGDLTINGGLIETDVITANGVAGPVGRNGYLVLNGGALRYTGGTASSNRFAANSLSYGAFEITNAATDFTINSTAFTSDKSYAQLSTSGLGTLSLAGSGSNTNLNIYVNSGTLELEKTGAASAVANLSVYGTGLVRLNSAGTAQISGGVSLYNSATFSLNGHSQAITRLYAYDTATTLKNGGSASATLTINGGADDSSSFAGALASGGAGTLALTKMGDSTMTLSGANIYSGATTISDGTLVFQSAASVSPNSNIALNSYSALGVGFDWSPTLGVGGGQLRWASGATYGALASYNYSGATVSIGGATPATLQFGQTSFVASANVLGFGAAGAYGTLNLKNPINLNNKLEYFSVYNSASSALEGSLLGVISNGKGFSLDTGGGNFAIDSSSVDLGFVKLAADNTFDGPVYVNYSGIEVDHLKNMGSGSSPLGAGSSTSTAILNLKTNAALRYTGSADNASNWTIGLGDSSVTSSYSAANAIVANGAGALNLTGAVLTLGDGRRDLYLSGASTADNRLSGTVSPGTDANDSIFLYKTGSGNWSLTGNATLAGLGAVDGVLELNGNVKFTGTLNSAYSVLRLGGLFQTVGAAPTFDVSGAVQLRGGVTAAVSLNFYGGGGLDGSGDLRAIDGNDTLIGTINLLNSDLNRISADAGATLTLDPASGPAVQGSQVGLAITFSGAGDITVKDPITLTGTAGGVTYDGTGRLTLSAVNPYTGPTVIRSGTLAIDNNPGASVPTAGRITVTNRLKITNGGTLLLSGSTTVTDRINNPAPVTIKSGGTLSTGGLSEGARAAGSAPGLGALSLQAGAIIDFGSGANGSTLLFTSGALSGNGLISILNWTGVGLRDDGAAGNDRLLFVNDPQFSAAQLAQFRFYNDSGTAYFSGGAEIAYNGFTQIVPVPEPATWWAGALLLAGACVVLRRRRVTECCVP